MSKGDKVWMLDDSCIGRIIKYGTYYSLVQWQKDGIEYIEYVENTEFTEYEIIDDE